MDEKEISTRIGKFISKTFLFDAEKTVDEKASLLNTGVIDSTGVLELISFIETSYNIKFADDDLVADNFDSIERITKFVSHKLNSTPP
jgi:acyl carrier protein